MSNSDHVQQLLAYNVGILLDVGAGRNKQSGYIGLDSQPLPGIDIVHDFEALPYPLPDSCCLTILAANVCHRINPAKQGFLNVMDEWHRLLKPKGRLCLSVPYAGSHAYYQDPCSINAVTETTLCYFTPAHPLYGIYEPKPWRTITNAWKSDGHLEAVLEPIKESKEESSGGDLTVQVAEKVTLKERLN